MGSDALNVCCNESEGVAMRASSLLVLMLASVSPLWTRPDYVFNSQDNLKSLEREFGPHIHDSPLLYTIDRDYVLEVNKGGRGILFVKVYPKHYREDLYPEWKPGSSVELSLEEYRNILSRISGVQNIGSLLTKGKVGIVSNTTLWLVDRYDKAYLEKGLYRTFLDSKREQTTVRSFNVYYLHRVNGVVEEKTRANRRMNEVTRVKVSGHWYFVDGAISKRMRIGQTIRASLAGPIDLTSQQSK